MSNSNEKAVMKEKLIELQHSYIKKLPSKLENLHEGFQQYLESGTFEDLEHLQRDLHSLHGTSAMYYLNEISQTSALMENAISQAVEQDRHLNDDEKQSISTYLAELDKLVLSEQNVPEIPISQNNLQLDTMDLSLPAVHGYNQKVLVVEDSKEQREGLTNILESFGFEVLALADIDDLSVIKRFKPQIVLMDIMLHHNSFGGTDAIYQLKKQNFLNCPVVFISVRNDFHARLEATRAGADAYIHKPFDIHQLVDTINTLTIRKLRDALKILIIDDEEDVLDLYSALLESEGMSTLCISNPESLIDSLYEYSPDLIVMDMYMNQYDGLELSKLVKQVRKFKHIPVVFLSAGSTDIKLSSIEAGAEDFLQKDMPHEQLVATLKYRARRGRELSQLLFHYQLNEQRLECLSESIPDAVMTLNGEGAILFCNEASESLLNVKIDNILGANLIDFVVDDDVDEVKDLLNNINHEERASLDFRLKESEGIKDIGISVFMMERNGQQYYTCVLRDISSRKQLEKQLIRSKDSAIESSQMKSDFISSMSHEFKTPLNAILGYSELFQFENQLPEKLKQSAKAINLAGQNLLGFVDEILDYELIQHGKMNFEYGEYSVLELLNEAIEKASFYNPKDVEIRIDLRECQTTTIYVDKGRFVQAVVHVLSNGLKYNRQNGLLNICCSELDMKIHLDFIDQGSGLSIHDIEEVFIPFNRLKATRSAEAGIGLGLPLVKAIIEALNGQVGLTSQPGKGSRFWIELPCDFH